MKTKRILIALLSIFGIILIYYSRNEIRNIFFAMQETSLRWLFVAVSLQVIVYILFADAHRHGLLAVGIERTRKELIPLILSALVVNSSTPSGGSSGTIVFIDDSIKRGESGAKTGAGIMIVIITNLVALFGILVGVLIFLKSYNELGLTEVISTGLLLLLIIATYVFLRIAKTNQTAVEVIFQKINATFYRIRRVFFPKTTIDSSWPKQIAIELHNASKSAHNNTRPIVQALIIFLLAHAVNIATIIVLFISFGIEPKLGVVISGYAIGELFKIISPSPEGIGITEASMAIIYSTFGVNPLIATSVALIYRALNFWIPFGLGFIYLNNKALS